MGIFLKGAVLASFLPRAAKSGRKSVFLHHDLLVAAVPLAVAGEAVALVEPLGDGVLLVDGEVDLMVVRRVGNGLLHQEFEGCLAIAAALTVLVDHEAVDPVLVLVDSVHAEAHELTVSIDAYQAAIRLILCLRERDGVGRDEGLLALLHFEEADLPEVVVGDGAQLDLRPGRTDGVEGEGNALLTAVGIRMLFVVAAGDLGDDLLPKLLGGLVFAVLAELPLAAGEGVEHGLGRLRAHTLAAVFAQHEELLDAAAALAAYRAVVGDHGEAGQTVPGPDEEGMAVRIQPELVEVRVAVEAVLVQVKGDVLAEIVGVQLQHLPEDGFFLIGDVFDADSHNMLPLFSKLSL